MVARDEAWLSAMLQCASLKPFKRADLGLAEDKRHTAQRVLNVLEEHRFLQRQAPQGHIWEPDIMSHFLFGEPGALDEDELEEVDKMLRQICTEELAEELLEEYPRE